MKMYASLTLGQIDTECVKGEELDEAVQAALEDIDIEGWEVQRAIVTREKQDDSVASQLKRIVPLLVTIARGENVMGNKVTLDSEFGTSTTYRQRLIEICEELTGEKFKL